LEKGFGERWLAEHRKNHTYPAALPREINPGGTAEFSLCCGSIRPGLKQATLEVEASGAIDTINAAINKASLQLIRCQDGFYRGNPPNEIMLDGWNWIEFRSTDKTMTLKKCMLHFEFSET
ncbi:MAG: hypothetical protein WCT05_10045, partial [Lentisphaeria bacterium]